MHAIPSLFICSFRDDIHSCIKLNRASGSIIRYIFLLELNKTLFYDVILRSHIK